MPKQQKKRSKQKTIKQLVIHKGISMVFFVLAILIFVAYSKEAIRAHNINREIKTMEREIAMIEKQNSAMFKNIEYYKTLAYLESEAKQKMGHQKPGEKVVILQGDYPELEALSEHQQDDVQVEEKTFNPNAWFEYFFVK